MYSIIGLPDKFKEETTLQYGNETSASFLETSSYSSSVSKEKPVLYIIGNKGAGKSAVLSKIYTENKDSAIVIYFKDFYNEIDKRVRQNLFGLTDQQIYLAYEKEWEIELWIQIIIHLYRVNYRNRILPFDTGDFEHLFQFLKKYKLPMDINLPTDIAARISKIKISIPGFTAEVNSEENDSKTLSQYDFNKIKGHAINVLGKMPIYLLIDEFDKIEKWDDSVRTSIRGLIESVFALIRDVNKEHRKENKLVVRVAIRGDMFNAAKIKYVDAQKIPRKGIDLAWSRDNLEELVAKKIRIHWELEPNQIHRGKIIREIFPVMLSKKQDVFGYLCILARLNPRALFSLIRDCTQSAIDRKELFIPSKSHPPLCIGRPDIQFALESNSDAQTEFVVDGNAFLYQELESIINFLEDELPSLLINGYIRSQDLRESIEVFLDENTELVAHLKLWPAPGHKLSGKIVRVLYDIGVLGIKKDKKNIFSPARYAKSGSLVIHPAYKPLLIENSHIRIGIDSSKEVENARLEVFWAIENLTDLIEPGRRSQISSNKTKEVYPDKDIVHGVARLVWSIRLLLKRVIAYGDQTAQESIVDPIVLIYALEQSLLKLTNLIQIDGKSLHTLAILYNPIRVEDWLNSKKLHDQERFEGEMDFPEHSELYQNHSQKLYKWVIKLLKEDDGKLSKQLDKILVEIRDNLNSPLSEGYTNS